MDIDIDLKNRQQVLDKITYINASRITETENTLHRTGIYVQPIPCNPITNASTIDYKEAEKRKYFKIDLLNVSVYDDIKSNEHLENLLKTEPVWELLEYEEFSSKLFHIGQYGHILRKMKPKSVEELAIVLAIIRPAKKHLIGKSWEEVRKEVWSKSEDGYQFRKAHAISYAMAIVVQMNLLCEQANELS